MKISGMLLMALISISSLSFSGENNNDLEQLTLQIKNEVLNHLTKFGNSLILLKPQKSKDYLKKSHIKRLLIYKTLYQKLLNDTDKALWLIRGHEFKNGFDVLHEMKSYIPKSILIKLIIAKYKLKKINNLYSDSFSNFIEDDNSDNFRFPETVSEIVFSYLKPYQYEILSTVNNVGNIHSLAWSPDDSKIGVGLEYGKIIILEKKNLISSVNSQAVLSFSLGHTDSVRALSWSPDGSKIAAGCKDGTIIICDTNTFEQIKTLEIHKSKYEDFLVNSISWSPDSLKIVAGYENNTAKIWDVTSGKILKSFNKHSGVITSVDWSQDGSKIATGSEDGDIIIWDAVSYQELNRLRISEDSCQYHNTRPYCDISSVSFSPDGSKIVAGVWDRTVRIWDVNTGDQLKMLTDHMYDRFISVKWSGDGSNIVTASYGRTIAVYDGNDYKLKWFNYNSEDRKGDIICSYDGRKIAVRNNKEIIIWEKTF